MVCRRFQKLLARFQGLCSAANRWPEWRLEEGRVVALGLPLSVWSSVAVFISRQFGFLGYECGCEKAIPLASIFFCPNPNRKEYTDKPKAH